jgi:hypothetical protein
MPAISSFATGDLLPIVDVSEISASDKNKSVTFGELFRNVLGGSASAPSIAFTGDQNTGIYSPGADQVAVATNGTGRLFVDASGNVGVGTSSVNALLEVNNSTAGGEVQRIEGNYSGSGSVILTNWRRAGGSVAAALKYNDDSSPLCMSIGTTTSHEFRIRTADTDAITIDTSQRVGIGTSSPSTSLHVVGGGMFASSTTGGSIVQARNSDFSSLGYFGVEGSTGGVTLTGTLANSTFISSGASGTPLQFGTGGVIRSTLTSTGLGIGTTSVSETLHLKASAPRIRIEDAEGGYSNIEGDGGSLGIYADNGNTQANSFIRFDIDGTEKSRLTSSGQWLVGTSTARSNIARYGADYTPATQIQTNETSGWGTGLSLVNYSASGYAPVLTFGLSGSNTAGTNTLVASGDRMGVITFNGNDGTNFEEGARIEAQVDGTPGANDMPGRLVFSTTADGASSPTERMRITNAGKVLIGTSTSANTVVFAVQSDVAGSAGGNYPLATIESTGTSDSGAACLHLGKKANDTSTSNVFQRFYINSSGTGSGQINANGASAAAFGSFSDERLKENIVDLPPEAIGRIETLEGMVAVNNITIDEQQHQLSTLAARLTALESA